MHARSPLGRILSNTLSSSQLRLEPKVVLTLLARRQWILVSNSVLASPECGRFLVVQA
jgi:hypothetical protein